jgi:hypothetical protein
MPSGTYVIDQRATFATAILMGSAPKTKFGETVQDVSANGERKWAVEAAITFHAQPGMRPVSEVISVTVTGPPADPAQAIPPGSPIEFDGFRVGVSTPEKRDNGRVVGGKPWHSATGVRAANGRPSPAPKGE